MMDRGEDGEYNFMPEARIAEELFLPGDTFIECVERLAGFEHSVEIVLPVTFLCVGHTETGNILPVTVDKFKKEETVEQPVFRAVGKCVGDVGHERFGGPVGTVPSALIDQHEIADLID